MTTFLFRWVVNAMAFMVIAMIIPGFTVTSFGYALLAAFVLGLMNAFVRPLLFILTLPVTIITLGLFVFVLNALMLWLVSTVWMDLTWMDLFRLFWPRYYFGSWDGEQAFSLNIQKKCNGQASHRGASFL